MHRICHKNSISGLYTEYRYRNNAQMARTGQYDGSERWQGTVIIENGDWYGKCRLPVVFSMERTGAPLPTAGSGVPGVTLVATCVVITTVTRKMFPLGDVIMHSSLLSNRIHWYYMCIAGTLGCVFMDNETRESGLVDTTRVCFIVHEHTTKCSCFYHTC